MAIEYGGAPAPPRRFGGVIGWWAIYDELRAVQKVKLANSAGVNPKAIQQFPISVDDESESDIDDFVTDLPVEHGGMHSSAEIELPLSTPKNTMRLHNTGKVKPPTLKARQKFRLVNSQRIDADTELVPLENGVWDAVAGSDADYCWPGVPESSVTNAVAVDAEQRFRLVVEDFVHDIRPSSVIRVRNVGDLRLPPYEKASKLSRLKNHGKTVVHWDATQFIRLNKPTYGKVDAVGVQACSSIDGIEAIGASFAAVYPSKKLYPDDDVYPANDVWQPHEKVDESYAYVDMHNSADVSVSGIDAENCFELQSEGGAGPAAESAFELSSSADARTGIEGPSVVELRNDAATDEHSPLYPAADLYPADDMYPYDDDSGSDSDSE